MGTLIVKVTPECEGLIHSLPLFERFNLINEEEGGDTDSGHYEVTLDFEGDDISAMSELALNVNPDVISYRIEKKQF